MLYFSQNFPFFLLKWANNSPSLREKKMENLGGKYHDFFPVCATIHEFQHNTLGFKSIVIPTNNQRRSHESLFRVRTKP